MPLSKCRNFKCFLHHWLLEKSLRQGLRCQHFTWEEEGWSNQDDGKKCKALFSEQFAYLRIKMTTLREAPWIDSFSTCKRSGRVTWRNHALEKPMRQRIQEELICLLFSRLISRTSNSPTLHSLGHLVTMAESLLYSEGFHKSKRGDDPPCRWRAEQEQEGSCQEPLRKFTRSVSSKQASYTPRTKNSFLFNV